MMRSKGVVVLGILAIFFLFSAAFGSVSSSEEGYLFRRDPERPGQPVAVAYGSVGLGSLEGEVVALGGSNVPPVAFFTMALGAAPVGWNLVFDASDSYDPDGSIASYSWDFGDGEVGEGASALHVYEEPGEYRATITVIDDGGAEDSACRVLEAQVFCATIVDVECPSEAGAGETFTVEVTVDYEFPVLTTVSPSILEVSNLEYAVEEFVERDGVGTEVFTFELTAPDRAVTWELEADVPFMVDESWLQYDVASSEAFSVEVGSGVDLSWRWLPDVPFEYLTIIGLTMVILVFLQKWIS